MKGQVEIGIIGMIFTVAGGIFMGIILLLFGYHLSVNLNIEYNYNNAQLTLLSLVSTKYNETYSMYRVISERNSNGFDESMKEKIMSDLDLLTHSKCFRLTDETSTILEKGDCSAAKSSGQIYMIRPYGQKLIEKISLVYE
jgi:membrane-bound ClpP family serine protease